MAGAGTGTRAVSNHNGELQEQPNQGGEEVKDREVALRVIGVHPKPGESRGLDWGLIGLGRDGWRALRCARSKGRLQGSRLSESGADAFRDQARRRIGGAGVGAGVVG